MARKSARPGRTVTVFFAVLAVAYALVALIGTWKPALGLDLEGGTQITLTAKDGQNVTKDNLNEAANIIDSRVNGSGVTEATVNTQGNNEIVVQVPGPTNNNSLVDTVVRQAQLRFRLVAQVPASTGTTTPQAPVVVGLARRRCDRAAEPRARRTPSPRRSPPARTGHRRCSARTRQPEEQEAEQEAVEDASDLDAEPRPRRRAAPARPPPARCTTPPRTRRPTRTRSPG